jgi:ATP-binding cassette subfamily C protein
MPGGLTTAMAAIAAQAVTESVSFLLLVPMLGAVGLEIAGGTVGRFSGYVRQAFAAVGLRPTLGVVLLVYVAVVALQALATQWQTTAVLGLEHRFVAALRKRLFSAITRAKWLYLSTARATDLSHVLTQELERVGTFTYQVLSLFSTALMSIVYLGLAFRLSPVMTTIVAGSGVLLLVVLRRNMSLVREEGNAWAQARARLFTTAVEHVSALRTAKSHGAEQRHIEGFGEAADNLADAHLQAIRVHAGSRTWFDIGAVAALALMLYVGLTALALTPAGVLLLLYVFARTMPRLSTLQQAIEYVTHHVASFEAYARLQAQADGEAEAAVVSYSKLPPFHDRIAFDGVTFTHPGGGASALENVTLTIPHGAFIAIVGQSGAGKSTFADLLTGLQRPHAGRITVDGAVIDGQMLSAWKHQIGYVDQDALLFHDTVRANLLWANPAATAADIDEALRLAAADFALDLPDGLETVLGDRGIRASGGERQRLALARALVRRPALLVLDEATSALDPENETRILEAIAQLKGRLTVVLITHRLSAVRDADVIHVLERGQLVESGNWGDLTRRAGRFQALCLAQHVDLAARPPAAAPVG